MTLPKPYFETDLGKLYHGDCLEIMPHLVEPVDLVLTDPPYVGLSGGYEYTNGGVGGSFQGTKTVGDTWGASYTWFGFVDRLCRCALISFTTYHGLCGCLNNIPGRLSLVGAWRKPNAHPGPPTTPRYTLEYYVGTRFSGPFDWKSIPDFIEYCQDFGGCISTGERIKTKDGKNAHPTQKPLAVFIPLVSNAQTVLDPFLGSGTTAVACEKLNRRWIGIEISEEYCEIAKRRIKAEYDQRKLFA